MKDGTLGEGVSLFGRAPWWFYLALLPFAAGALVLAAIPDWRIALAEHIVGKREPLPPQPPQSHEVKKEELALSETKEVKTATSSTIIGVDSWISSVIVYGTRYNGPKTALRVLRVARITLSDEVLETLGTMPGIPEKRELEVTQANVSDLGFTKPATMSEVMLRAAENGYRMIPLAALPAIVTDPMLERIFTSAKRIYFAMQVGPSDHPWRTVMFAEKSEDGTVALAQIDWSGFYARNFEKDRTFDPRALFLFARSQ